MATVKQSNQLLAGEVARFIFLIKQWENNVFKLQGASTSQTKVNVNKWLEDLELIYKNNMPTIDILGGFEGYTVANEEFIRIGGLGVSTVSRSDYANAYRSRVTALASKELVKARGLRNSLAIRWKDKSEEFFEALDVMDKQAFGLGLTSSQRAKRFLDSGIGRLATGVITDGVKGQRSGILTGKRIWKPETYAQMYSRTRAREMEDEIHEDEIQEVGLDVIQITNANTTTPICLQYENKIFSLTGATPGLPVLQVRPPFHPNCRHRVRALEISEVKALEINSKVDSNFAKEKLTKGEKKSIRKQEAWITTNRPSKAA